MTEPRRIRIQQAVREILEGPVVPAGDPQDEFTKRMAQQRRDWRKQDLQRYKDEQRERLSLTFRDDTWNVYGWSPLYRKWIMLGKRPVKSHRRKPMTMNRLFAAIRQRFGVPKHVTIKLITELDDALRRRRGEKFGPPTRVRGRYVPGAIAS